MTTPTRLRVEHLGRDALGLGVERPRLSWWLPSGIPRQARYEVALEDGRSAEIESDRHVLRPWPFEPLRSRERTTWRVRVHGGAGWSDWSDPATIETGLLRPGDWSARWVGPDEGRPRPPGERPAWLLRRSFDLGQPLGAARLHATAHGIYEAFLNGRRIGDLELTPGFTSYATNLDVQTHDVTELLRPGTNDLQVVLSDGWYRGRHGNAQHADGFGEAVAFLGQLEVGDDVVVATDPSWEAAVSPILRADLMGGQAEDHRVEPGRWTPVLVLDGTVGPLTTSPAPPVRRVEDVRPRSVTRLAAGGQVVDLGQNINGWVRIDRLGPSGTHLRLHHAEALDPSGDITTTHLEPLGIPLGQLDEVTSAGRIDETFEPRHTVHGFQYVRVDGHPDELTTDDVTGVVVHTDLVRTGWFRCSDDRLNRLHEIADWSFRDNACDIPTDCPHRERSGWTGDWLLFQPTAAFLYDVAGFSTKWLRDLAAEQLDDGMLPNYVPDPRRRRALAEGDPSWRGLFGSSGWADACVLVPWELHHLYGDERVLAELWPTMVRWLDHVAELARTQRHHARVAAAPFAAPHEAFLWDAGWHFGEWCEPDTGGEPWYAVDQGHVGTAYLHRTAGRAARIGQILGDGERSAAFRRLADGALDAWRREYIAEDGSLSPDTQANHVRALAFGLVPDQLRARTADRLVELIREAGTHLGTGFLATPHLLPVLADTGHLDVAYEVLLQDTPPSWLTMVARGASTIWETWEGIDEDGVAHESVNHYSKGAVISFLHRYVAGIQPIDDELAYRRFRIAPLPGGGLTWAEAQFDSPSGRIEVSWRLGGRGFEVDLTIPPGTSAVLDLPDGSSVPLGPGTSGRTCSLP
jgi:alpha-L-rhamnosidase